MLDKDNALKSNQVAPITKGKNIKLVGIIAILVLIVGAGVAWRFRRDIRAAYWTGRAVLASSSMRSDGDFTNVLFVHQSVGQNLISQGNMRALFAEAGYELWDHSYNYIGLTRPDGSSAGYSYNIPGDNTYPDGYAGMFTQPVRSLPTNPVSAILQHEVVLFKSCYPASHIDSAEKLNEYEQYYLGIRDVADQHPDRIFIALTPPPLVGEATHAEAAARAREFANWLKSDEFLAGHANFFTFDLFDLLAENDPSAPDYNTLRTEYRPDHLGDSHPNIVANEAIAPQLVEFVISAVQSYRESR